MKKLLAIILALILCLSVAAVFTSCNSSDDKGADATDNNGADATEPEATEPPSPVNKEVATQAFNKIDLATFLSTTESSLEELQKVSARAEANLTTPDGSGSIIAAVKNGNFYVSLKEEGYDAEEMFGKIGDEKISVYALIDGVWETVNEVAISPEDIYADAGVNPEELISKIKIPALKEEHLTEKGDMLLVSNDYIYELVAENIAVIAGEEIPAESLEEVKAELKADLESAGLEILVATGAEEITKIAVSVKPTDESFDFKSAKIEVALTDDAKNLKSVKAEWTANVGEPEMNEIRTSKIELSTVVVENELVGAKATAEIYGYDYDYSIVDTPIMTPSSRVDFETDINGSISDGDDFIDDGFTFDDTFAPLTDICLITKTTIAFDLDMSKLAEESGKVLTLDVDHTVEAAYEITSTIDPETFELEEEITKLDSVDAYKDSNVTIDASVTMNGAERADFALNAKMGEDKVTASGYLAIGDIEFPAIPDALKSKLN